MQSPLFEELPCVHHRLHIDCIARPLTYKTHYPTLLSFVVVAAVAIVVVLVAAVVAVIIIDPKEEDDTDDDDDAVG